MELELRRLLDDYLEGQADLDDITNWMARNIWDAPNVEDSLVDEVAIELAFLDDGFTSEEYFRSQIRELLGPHVVVLFAGSLDDLPLLDVREWDEQNIAFYFMGSRPPSTEGVARTLAGSTDRLPAMESV